MGFRPKTRTELYEHRKMQLKEYGNHYMESWISDHPYRIEILKPDQVVSPDVSVVYKENPRVKTKTELEFMRKQQGMIENELTRNFHCKTLSQRVEQRENFIRIPSGPVKLTRNASRAEKRAENIEEFEKKFIKRPVGVHGEELPKFSEHLKDYWKLKEGYIENPYVKVKEKAPSRPISEFARLRVKSSSVDYQITVKPNQNNPFPGFVINDASALEKRSSSRIGFSNDSRPLSKISSENAFSVRSISRPASEIRNFNNVKGERSSTANSFRGPHEKILIRSSGFL